MNSGGNTESEGKSCDGARDDAAMRHFKARAARDSAHTSVECRPQVNVIFDSPFGQTPDSNLRFRYIGTSPQYSRQEAMLSRRNLARCMRGEDTRWC